jgi:putative transposase
MRPHDLLPKSTVYA